MTGLMAVINPQARWFVLGALACLIWTAANGAQSALLVIALLVFLNTKAAIVAPQGRLTDVPPMIRIGGNLVMKIRAVALLAGITMAAWLRTIPIERRNRLHLVCISSIPTCHLARSFATMLAVFPHADRAGRACGIPCSDQSDDHMHNKMRQPAWSNHNPYIASWHLDRAHAEQRMC